MSVITYTPTDKTSRIDIKKRGGFVLVSFDGQLLTQDEYRFNKSVLSDFADRTYGSRLEIYHFADPALATNSNASSKSSGFGVCDRIRMIISNHFRDATLSSNYTTATALDNAKNEWRSRKLRNITPSEPLIICGVLPLINGLPSVRLFSGLAIAAHTLSVSATVKLELLDGDCGGRVMYDSGELKPTLIKPLGEYIFGVDPWGEVQDDTVDPVFAHFFESVAASAFRITITDPNPNGFWDISQLFLGDTLQLENNFSYGFSIKWANNQSLTRTEGGSLISVGNAQQWRELSLPFDFMSEWDQAMLSKQQRLAPNKAIFISAFPKGTDGQQREFAMSCKFESPTFTQSRYQNWQTAINFLET